MPIVFKTLLLQAGIIAVSICVGATAMYAWQAGRAKPTPTLYPGQHVHIHPAASQHTHIDNLPVR
jgi:hypothetical protein